MTETTTFCEQPVQLCQMMTVLIQKAQMVGVCKDYPSKDINPWVVVKTEGEELIITCRTDSEGSDGKIFFHL